MSTRERRTDKLYTELTARERALLVLRAAQEGREPSWLIWGALPPEQNEDFDGYVALVQGMALAIAPHALALEREVADVGLQLTMLALVAAWGAERTVLHDYLAALTAEPIALEMMDGPSSPLAVLPGFAPSPDRLRPEEELTGWDRLMRGMADALRRDLTRVAAAFGALETVVAEVRGRFGGYDPLHPLVRAAIERTRTELAAALQGAALVLPGFVPPGVDEAAVRRLRAQVRGEG